MRVLSWNIHAIRGADERLTRIVDAIAGQQSDVVLLQEVASRYGLPARLRGALRERGLTHFHFGGHGPIAGKRYGNVIAARWPVRPYPRVTAAPFPQLIARAMVDHPGGTVDVLNVHVPNGVGNGWRKIETLEVLADLLERAEDAPRILAGDFNEPQAWPSRAPLISFGQCRRGDTWTTEGTVTYLGETDSRERWQRAVERVLDNPHHGLRHAYRSYAPDAPTPGTHITTAGRERFFDHVLVSRHFEIVGAGFEHGWRIAGLSDHSGATAELLRGEKCYPAATLTS